MVIFFAFGGRGSSHIDGLDAVEEGWVDCGYRSVDISSLGRSEGWR
jgi:hypothetical protein